MPDPKKKQTKGTPAKKKAGQTGYGPQNRPGTFAKKKKVKKKGPKLKGVGKIVRSGSAKSVAALRKAALLKAKKKGVKKPMKPVVKAKRGSSRTKRKSLRY